MQEPSNVDVTELESPNETIYKVENILRWRRRKVKNKYIGKFLVSWVGYPLEDAMWSQKIIFLTKTPYVRPRDWLDS